MEEADQVLRQEDGVEKEEKEGKEGVEEKVEVGRNLTAGLSAEKKLDRKMDDHVVAISRIQELDDEVDQNMGKDSGAGSSQEIKVDEEEELGRALLSSYSGEEESLEGRGESSVLIPCETLTIIDFFNQYRMKLMERWRRLVAFNRNKEQANASPTEVDSRYCQGVSLCFDNDVDLVVYR